MLRVEAVEKEGKDGGADRDRTDDLLNAIQALSQLSYGPFPAEAEKLANPARVVKGDGEGGRAG